MIEDQLFEIRVRPLVSERSPLVAFLEDGATPILQRHLDAARLAMLTGSNPRYSVLRAPQHGRILRRVRRSEAKRGRGQQEEEEEEGEGEEGGRRHRYN